MADGTGNLSNPRLGFVSPVSSPSRVLVRSKRSSASCASILRCSVDDAEGDREDEREQQQQQQQQQVVGKGQAAGSEESQDGMVDRRDVLKQAMMLAGLAAPLAANNRQAAAVSLPSVYLPPPPSLPDKVTVWVPSIPSNIKGPKPLDLNLEKNLQLQKPMNEVRQMQRNFDKFIAPLKDPNRGVMISRVQESLTKAKELKKFLAKMKDDKLIKVMDGDETEYAKRFLAVWIAPAPGYMNNILSTATNAPDKAKKIPDQLTMRVAALDKALTSKNRYTTIGEMEDVLELLNAFLKSGVANI